MHNYHSDLQEKREKKDEYRVTKTKEIKYPQQNYMQY